MKKTFPDAVRIAVLVAAAFVSQGAAAQDVTVVGPLTKIVWSDDGQSAVATLQDHKSGVEVEVNVRDELTLDKFKDKRIVEGDEIRARLQNKDGQKAAKSFRKTAGC